MADIAITRMTVRRPDGTVEIVEREGAFGNSAQFRKQATEATRAAGRGEIPTFEVVANPAMQITRSRIERRRIEREQLVGDIQAAIETQADAYEAAHAREDVLAEQIKASHEPAIKAARAAVAAFDAAHPEVGAAIRTEQRERTERFLRQD